MSGDLSILKVHYNSNKGLYYHMAYLVDKVLGGTVLGHRNIHISEV